jgi:hypothetical protein
MSFSQGQFLSQFFLHNKIICIVATVDMQPSYIFIVTMVTKFVLKIKNMKCKSKNLEMLIMSCGADYSAWARKYFNIIKSNEIDRVISKI